MYENSLKFLKVSYLHDSSPGADTLGVYGGAGRVARLRAELRDHVLLVL